MAAALLAVFFRPAGQAICLLPPTLSARSSPDGDPRATLSANAICAANNRNCSPYEPMHVGRGLSAVWELWRPGLKPVGHLAPGMAVNTLSPQFPSVASGSLHSTGGSASKTKGR